MATVRGPRVTSSGVTSPGEPIRQVELVIGGMSCAACAARIERKLNRLDGVSASVNYATEKARVSYPNGVTPEDLVTVVVHTGYTAELALDDSTQTQADAADEVRVLRDRLAGSAVLAVR